MNNTFFNLKLDLDPNIINMIYDLLRMSTIQLVTQIMFYMNNSSLSLFNETFVKTFIFINISIIFYYLVVSKVFSISGNDISIQNNVNPIYSGIPSDKRVAPVRKVQSNIGTPKVINKVKNNDLRTGSTSISDLPNNI